MPTRTSLFVFSLAAAVVSATPLAMSAPPIARRPVAPMALVLPPDSLGEVCATRFKEEAPNTAHSTLSLTPLSCARFLLFLHTTDHRRRGRPQLPLALPGPHHHPHPALVVPAGSGHRPAAARLHGVGCLPQPLPWHRASHRRHRHLADWRILRAQPAAGGRRVARGHRRPRLGEVAAAPWQPHDAEAA